ncbi:hypothetical protein OSTOST_16061 [Ostertagia ostertagi]
MKNDRYTVEIGPRHGLGTIALQLVVQGPKSPDYVHERVEAFLEKIRIAVFVHSKNDKRDEIVAKTEATDHPELKEIKSMEQFRRTLPLYGLPRAELDLMPIGVDPLV